MFRNPVVDAIVILVIVLLILGPKRLPELGKGLGHGMREFKEGITGDHKHDEEADRPALSSAPPPPTASAESTPDQARDSAEVGSKHQS
jgi:sec-independent protein translocase protein TatA